MYKILQYALVLLLLAIGFSFCYLVAHMEKQK